MVFSGFAQKHNGVIRGKVTTSDGKPAESVSVLIKEKKQGVVTDDQGQFEFQRLTPGEYTVVISYTGHEEQEKTVNVNDDKQPELVSFQLKASSGELQEVIVVSGRSKFGKKESGYVARLPLKNIENPQVYNVVGRELLQEQMVVNFDDVLKNAPGVDKLWTSTGRAGDGAGYFSMRGFSVQPTMINGIAGLTNGGLDPANIERIEAIKGPSGTLFGSSLISFGGLINIVTKKPYDSLGGEISYTAGSYGLSRVQADINAPLDRAGKALLRVNGAYHYEGSWQDAGFRKSIFLAPSLSYKASDRLSFLVNAEFFSSEGTNPLSVFLNRTRELVAKTPEQLNMNWKRSFTSNDITIKNPTTNINAQANYRINSQWVSQTNLSRSVRKTDGLYSYVMFNNPYGADSILNRYISDQNGIGTATGIQQNFIGDFYIGSMRNRVVAGLDFLSIELQNNSSAYITYDTVSAQWEAHPNYGKINRENVEAKLGQNTAPTKSGSLSNTYSAYVSDVLNITPRLAAMLSVRIDRFDNRGSFNYSSSTEPLKNSKYAQTSVSPKFGLSYQLIPEQLSVFGNYMNGFQNVAPVNQPIEGYPTTFKPQQANQIEGGVKLDVFNRKLSLSASVYEIEVTDITRSEVVTKEGVEYNVTVQNGSQRSRGVELDLVAHPLPGLNIVAGYAYNDSRYLLTTVNLTGRRPNTAGAYNQANAWISYSVIKGKMKGLGIGVGGNYSGDNFTTNQKPTGIHTIPAYTVLNGTIFYNTRSYRLGIKVDNITDELYWKGWSTLEPQMPRRVSASIAFRF